MRAQEKRFFDVNGKIYSNGKETIDHSNVNIINTHIDTYKQYYKGATSNLYLKIKEQFEVLGADSIVTLRGIPFALRKLGKMSGYRYKLQNNEIGLVIMVGSFFQKETLEGLPEWNNLKIECSPHYLMDRPAKLVTADLAAYADELLLMPLAICGVPHMAVDVQGYEIPHDFVNRFVSRLDRCFSVNGVDAVEIYGQAVAFMYGERETVTIGGASGLQLCTYNKTIESRKSGKSEYWKKHWFNSSDEYDIDKDVIRFEWRVPKQVIQQMSKPEMQFRDYSEVFQNINSLWLYCCVRNRLHHSSRFIDPMWQMLTENVQFNDAAAIEVTRTYQKQKPLQGRGGHAPDTKRNMLMVLGNLVTIYAARGFNDGEVVECVKSCGIWDELCWYYLFKENWSEQQIESHIIDRVHLRRLVA